MKKVLALTLILTLAAVSTSYAIVNQLEQSEEQMLNGLENQFAEGEDTASFSQLDREAELNDIPSEGFGPSSDHRYLINSTVRENQLELQLVHYGSSSISPGQVREAYLDEGELNVLLAREKPVVVTADMNLQKNAYMFETENQTSIETVNVTEINYRDREDTYQTNDRNELLQGFRSVFEDRWVLVERNYSLGVDESVFKESLENGFSLS